MKTPAAMVALLVLGWATGFGKFGLAVVVCICRLLGLRSLGWLWPVTCLVILGADAFSGYEPTHWPEPEFALESRYGENYLNDWAIKFLGTTLRLAAGLLLFRLIAGLAPRTKLLVLHLLALMLIGLCGPLPANQPVLGALLLFFMLSCGFSFYLVCYLTLECPNLSNGNFLRLFLAPFWETAMAPRPVMQMEPDLEQSDKLTSRCLRVAARTALMVLAVDALDAFLFGRNWHGIALPRLLHPLPDLRVTGLAPELFGVYSRGQLWFSQYWSAVYHVTNYFGAFAFLECCHLMVAYDVPSRFTFPWKCRTFSEFYNSIMPYYVMLVNRVYLYPCFSWLRTRGLKKKPAYELALFFGVLTTGFFVHLLRDLQLVPLLGGTTYIRLALQTDLPYFLILFLCLRLAVLPKTWPYWLNFLFFTNLYALVLLFRRGGLFTTLDERWNFLLHLFY